MSDLRATLTQLSETFATQLFAALRGASVEEILAVTHGASASLSAATTARAPRSLAAAPAASKPAKTSRKRTPEDVTKTVQAIASVLRKHPKGMRSEELQKLMKLEKQAIVLPLVRGVETGALTKTGEKRSTRYFAK